MSHTVRRLVLVATTCFTLFASSETQAQQCQGVQYQGGSLIEKVKIVTVYWGMAAAADRKNIDDAYLKMVQAPYLDWLREYDAGGYKIRRGTFAASVIDPSPPSKTVVDDQRDLVPHLAALIDAKTVPKPDDDTLYMVHFPASVTVTMWGSSSCREFCAYHSSFTHNGQVVRYAAMPDQNGGGCQNGCGVTSPNPVDSTSLTASHEVIEAITDPDPGQGWYDTVDSNSTYCGEVGDICNAMPGSANGAVVQKIWSNKRGCIDHDATVKVIDFSLALSQASVTMYPGMSASVTVTSTPAANAASGNAALTITGLPMGVTAAAAPATIATTASSMLGFTADATAVPGSYTYTVTGTSAGDNVIHSVTGTIVVSDIPPPPPPDMSDPGSGGGSGGGGNGDNGDNTGPMVPGVGGGGSDGMSPSSGCSMSGDASAGLALAVLAVLLILGLTRRRT